jgi:outer membrane biosynthesis protein TonB
MSYSSALPGEKYYPVSLCTSSHTPPVGRNTFSSSTNSALPPFHPQRNSIPSNQIHELRFSIEGVDNTLKDIGRAMIDFFSRDKTASGYFSSNGPHQHENENEKKSNRKRKRKRGENKKKVEEQESEEKIQSNKKSLKSKQKNNKEKPKEKETEKKQEKEEEKVKFKPKHIGSGTDQDCSEKDLLEEYIKQSGNNHPSSSSSSSRLNKTNYPTSDASDRESDSSE